ncbi:MAG: RnfH family protein [Legionellales bacterium]|nr:RnfH family protein [Legionellales bacterium]
MNIEIVYALPDEQELLTLTVAAGTTVQQAIEASNILTKYPEIDLNENKVGIFSKLVSLDTVLRDKDRIEIYRPLTIDPKEARFLRVKKRDKSS